MTETVYLVKFDRGYYATKQKGYKWSFTDDPFLAQKYKTFEKAEARGKWGLGLIKDALNHYAIEKYQMTYTMEMCECTQGQADPYVALITRS